MRTSIHEPASCPECGQVLQTLWDYPSNELWCLQCGNRFYETLAPETHDPLHGFRVLIVDPDNDRRDQFTHQLMTLGYLVTSVCHPRQALEAASFRRFEFVVVAAQLPEITVSQFANQFRGLIQETRFILMDEADHFGGLGQKLEVLIDDLVSSRRHPAASSDEVAAIR